MTRERPRRPGEGGGGGNFRGLDSRSDRTAGHLDEVAARVTAIGSLSRADYLPELASGDRLSGINGLAAVAAIHLAAVREHVVAA